ILDVGMRGEECEKRIRVERLRVNAAQAGAADCVTLVSVDRSIEASSFERIQRALELHEHFTRSRSPAVHDGLNATRRRAPPLRKRTPAQRDASDKNRCSDAREHAEGRSRHATNFNMSVRGTTFVSAARDAADTNTPRCAWPR